MHPKLHNNLCSIIRPVTFPPIVVLVAKFKRRVFLTGADLERDVCHAGLNINLSYLRLYVHSSAKDIKKEVPS